MQSTSPKMIKSKKGKKGKKMQKELREHREMNAAAASNPVPSSTEEDRNQPPGPPTFETTSTASTTVEAAVTGEVAKNIEEEALSALLVPESTFETIEAALRVEVAVTGEDTDAVKLETPHSLRARSPLISDVSPLAEVVLTVRENTAFSLSPQPTPTGSISERMAAGPSGLKAESLVTILVGDMEPIPVLESVEADEQPTPKPEIVADTESTAPELTTPAEDSRKKKKKKKRKSGKKLHKESSSILEALHPPVPHGEFPPSRRLRP
ncbi:hypothetical protein N7454_010866 [Penicillium verhagenii]|nr:hypothetical protein N7454_010866 [Penicillium verhagenii]